VIKTLPRKGFRFVGEAREQPNDRAAPEVPGAREGVAALSLPDRPSLAVLPFTNIGGDPEQDYFADGIVEEVITELSRIRWMFVVARNSSFIYKNRIVDLKEVGRELGVRYVVQGSVRKAAPRLRITAQLVDAATGSNLWADRFDGTLEDVFDLQDQLTTRIVAAIAPRLEKAEIARAKRKTTGSLDAYDTYLRGVAAFHQWTRDATDEALACFTRAIELGPDLAAAYGMAAMVHSRRKGSGWSDNNEEQAREIKKLARQVVKVGQDDAVALSFCGYALAHAAGELDEGAALVDQALDLNPNLAIALVASGWMKVWLGEQEVAIERLQQAIRLSPLDPFRPMMEVAVAHAHFYAGRFAEGASWAERALRGNPESYPGARIAVACYASGDQVEEAKKAVERLLELKPAFRVSKLRDSLGAYRYQKHITTLRDSAAKSRIARVGLPSSPHASPAEAPRPDLDQIRRVEPGPCPPPLCVRPHHGARSRIALRRLESRARLPGTQVERWCSQFASPAAAPDLIGRAEPGPCPPFAS
jgi:TolB-like protein